jgi:hypothetical protein
MTIQRKPAGGSKYGGERKSLTIGQINERKDGKGENMTIDAYNLDEFITYLQEYRKLHLEGKTKAEISAAIKSREIPQLYVSLYDPLATAPAFILKNLVITK